VRSCEPLDAVDIGCERKIVIRPRSGCRLCAERGALSQRYAHVQPDPFACEHRLRFAGDGSLRCIMPMRMSPARAQTRSLWLMPRCAVGGPAARLTADIARHG